MWQQRLPWFSVRKPPGIKKADLCSGVCDCAIFRLISPTNNQTSPGESVVTDDLPACKWIPETTRSCKEQQGPNVVGGDRKDGTKPNWYCLDDTECLKSCCPKKWTSKFVSKGALSHMFQLTGHLNRNPAWWTQRWLFKPEPFVTVDCHD